MRIETKDISVIIDKKEIIKKMNIHVENGEFIGIVGANGSGKSTFLKTIYRVLKPTTGVVNLDNNNIYKLNSKEVAQNMAVLSQESPIQFDFLVEDIVMMGRSPRKKSFEPDSKEDFKIVYDALKKVGMYDFRKRKYLSLSGGEKQRVLLARALTQEPKVLILDEPTNHLDIKYQLQLMDIVKELGITVFSAIHDMNIAAKYCDRIYAVKKGEILYEGTPEQVFTKEFFKEIFQVDADISYHEKAKRLNIVYL